MESKELAYKALAALEADLDSWDQGQWDTCFASFVCRANGDNVSSDDVDAEDTEPGLIGHYIGVRAAELLGIEVPRFHFGPEVSIPEPGDIPLFDEQRTVKDIRIILSELFGEPA